MNKVMYVVLAMLLMVATSVSLIQAKSGENQTAQQQVTKEQSNTKAEEKKSKDKMICPCMNKKMKQDRMKSKGMKGMKTMKEMQQSMEQMVSLMMQNNMLMMQQLLQQQQTNVDELRRRLDALDKNEYEKDEMKEKMKNKMKNKTKEGKEAKEEEGGSSQK